MSIGMELLRGDTTQNSTHYAIPTEIDFSTGHDQSVKKIGRVEYQGEQVYRTSTHNALALKMLVDQIAPNYQKIMRKSMHMLNASRRCWT
jgi:hypothetical protein